jgi:hypothetical protein
MMTERDQSIRDKLCELLDLDTNVKRKTTARIYDDLVTLVRPVFEAEVCAGLNPEIFEGLSANQAGTIMLGMLQALKPHLT